MFVSHESAEGLRANAHISNCIAQTVDTPDGPVQHEYRRISDEGIAAITTAIRQTTWYLSDQVGKPHVAEIAEFRSRVLAMLPESDQTEFLTRLECLDSAPRPMVTYVPYLDHDGRSTLPGPGMPQYAIDGNGPNGVFSH